MKDSLLLFLTFAFLINIACFAYAEGNEPSNADLLKEIESLKRKIVQQEKRITELETKLSSQLEQQQEQVKEALKYTPGEGVEISEVGISVSAGATFIIQGAIDANNTGGKGEDITDASYSIDLELEKEFEDFGLAFIHLETGDGAGIEDELQVFSNVNRDADDSDNSISLTEAWYEHHLFDKQLTLRAGKIDPTRFVDQNEIANDECTQFLGRIFRNAPAIDFPDNTAGVSGLIALERIPWFEFEGQILDGDDGWEDIADTIFTTYQINLKPTFLGNLSGNYRVYGWYKHTPYIKWADSNNQQDEDKHGFGISADQQLSGIFTIFGRYSWCDPDVYSSGEDFSLEHTWSAGCQLSGKPWGREQDRIALAVGMAMPSDEYKKAGSNLKTDDEGHFEAYYSWCVNEHLTLSPDIHIIWNPYGGDYTVSDEKRDDTITIIGCRGQVDF